MGKSSRVSGWEVFLGSKDRVMVLNTSHVNGEEEVLGEWDARNKEFRDVSVDNDKIEG